MKKRQYVLIGHPILHSISPFIHNRLFEISKVDAEYKMLDIKPESLEYSMSILRNLDGYNVTIPHKFRIINLLDDISEKSRLYRSVNTVKNGDISVGYTTDAYGFLKALEYEKIEAAGRVVIIGAGGVGSVIAHELARMSCEVVIAVRGSGIGKAELLAKRVRENTGNNKIDFCETNNIQGSINLLVNATPVGMYPQKDESVVESQVLKTCNQVYDAVYNPYQTRLVREARALGVRAASGLSMLVFQAVSSHGIWDGSEYKDDDVKQLILDCMNEINRGFE